MKCATCQRPLEASGIKPHIAIDEATELHLHCECGAYFYTFVQHRDWHDVRGDSVDLAGDGVEPAEDSAPSASKKGPKKGARR